MNVALEGLPALQTFHFVPDLSGFFQGAPNCWPAIRQTANAITAQANRTVRLCQTYAHQLHDIGIQQVKTIQYQQRQIANRDTQIAQLRAQLGQAQGNVKRYATQFSQCHARRQAVSADLARCQGLRANCSSELELCRKKKA